MEESLCVSQFKSPSIIFLKQKWTKRINAPIMLTGTSLYHVRRAGVVGPVLRSSYRQVAGLSPWDLAQRSKSSVLPTVVLESFKRQLWMFELLPGAKNSHEI